MSDPLNGLGFKIIHMLNAIKVFLNSIRYAFVVPLCLIAISLLPISSCASNDSSGEQSLIILPNGLVELNGFVDSFPSSLAKLGPTSNHVTLIVCPNASFYDVIKIRSNLNAAGYDKIGFAPIGRKDAGICVSSLAQKLDAHSKL